MSLSSPASWAADTNFQSRYPRGIVVTTTICSAFAMSTTLPAVMPGLGWVPASWMGSAPLSWLDVEDAIDAAIPVVAVIAKAELRKTARAARSLRLGKAILLQPERLDGRGECRWATARRPTALCASVE